MVKEKDGAFGKEKVDYVNSVTGMKSHEVPPPLPKGWKEALHKDSGRVYYVHKATRKTTFTFPAEAEGDPADDYSGEWVDDKTLVVQALEGRGGGKTRGK